MAASAALKLEIQVPNAGLARRCFMCRQLKPLEDFAFRDEVTGRRQSHCRRCHAAYRRAHYEHNRDDYIRREVARIRTYREENRVHLREYLARHPCIGCSEADPVVLEFDHRDPSSKRWNVTVLAMHKPWPRVLAEIEKCDVRCAACHRRRTAKQFGWRKARASEEEVPSALLRGPTLMKGLLDCGASIEGERMCTGCGATKKTLTDFPYRNRAKGTRRSRCRACLYAYGRRHYEGHRADYLARAKSRNRSDRGRFRARVLEYLKTHHCADCGESDPLILEFDHRDRASKIESVAALLARRSWRAIEEEIAKCDVRCVNCHRRRTARQFRWSRLLPLTSDAVDG